MMKLHWLGHSCFRVECENSSLILDPFEPGSVPGLRDIHETADQVLCSHEHHDHNARGCVALTGRESGIAVTALASFHDDTQGAQRGSNLIHLLEGGGVRVAHMGDIGCMPAPEIIGQLKGVDALLLPVGGYFTVGPEEAMKIVKAVQPRVVIPMHYRSDAFGFDVIGPVEDFLALCGSWSKAPGSTIEIVPGMDPQTVVLSYQ